MPSTTSRAFWAGKTIDRLEELGYVHRSGDDADRRRKLARLTPRGIEVLAMSAMIFNDIRAVRRGRLFVFLRLHRHELFDEPFRAELAQAWVDSPKGQPPVPQLTGPVMPAGLDVPRLPARRCRAGI